MEGDQLAALRHDGACAISKEPAEARKPDRGELYAALDLGTNSCRMLIARPKGNRFLVFDSYAKTVRLGLGLETSGRLSSAAMGRAVEALRVCRKKLKKHRVSRMRLVATEACRRAGNADEFIAFVGRETGLAFEIIQPEEEVRLAVVACASLVSDGTEQLLVVDIGGGSTELVWIDLTRVPGTERAKAIMRLQEGFGSGAGPHPRAEVVDWISVPLGVATLREQFDDVRDEAGRFALMSCHFEENLAEFAPYMVDRPRAGFQIIGTSGTVTTVAARHLGLKRYDRRKVDGLRLTSDQIDKVIRDCFASATGQPSSGLGFGRGRHALIMSGAAILQALLRVWPTNRLSVADRGIREGLHYAQMNSDGVLADCAG